MLVDGLQSETAPRHLDEGHGAGRVRGMALEPLVDGLIGDTEIGVVGQAGDDAGHAEVGHPAAELGLPAIGGALEAARSQCLGTDHPRPLVGPLCFTYPVPCGCVGDVLPSKDKGGVRGQDGDKVLLGTCRYRATFEAGGIREESRKDAAPETGGLGGQYGRFSI